MKKRLILVGPGGSGKDYARSLIERSNILAYATPYTTRPKRENEIDGKDYHFVSKEVFEELIRQKKLVWYNTYIDCYYGAPIHQFMNSGKFFIIPPTSIHQLSKDEIEKSLIIYFEIPVIIRFDRMNTRKGNIDNVKRRIQSDSKDFKDYTLFDYKITDPFFTLEDLTKIIHENIEVYA